MKKVAKAAIAVMIGAMMMGGVAQADGLTAPPETPTYELGFYQPMVQLKSKKAQKAINNYMLEYGRKLPGEVDSYTEYDAVCEATVHNVVSYQSEKVISIVTDIYFNMEGSAHPNVCKYGRIFSTDDGHALTLKELAAMPEFKDRAANYTIEHIRKAIRAKYGKTLYSDPKYVDELKMPQDLFIDDKGHVNAVVQLYEVGPYAAGLIIVNLDVPDTPLSD